ncbi:MAG: hypothetical protein R3B84_12095 [Zavarzinella sp.]
MSAFTRRGLFATCAGAATAALTLETSELFAQNKLDFVPLQLNRQGQGQLNQQVTAMDQHEDQLLDDLLAGNQNNEIRDLGDINNDLTGIQRNPGLQLGNQQNIFGQEAQQIQVQINLMTRQRMCQRRNIFGCVRMVDFFVGHWYPCNDILEIGTCESKIWNYCNLRRPNFMAIEFYLEHLRYEMMSMFQYHRCNGRFLEHSTQLVTMVTRVERCASFQMVTECRTEMMRLSMATDIMYRKYYPQWC